MVDRVRPFKLEGSDQGGTEDDEFPTTVDPNEDGIECRSVFLQNDSSDDETVVISRDGSGNMTFADGIVSGTKTLNDLLSGGGGTSVLGEDFQYAVSEGESSTTSDIWQTKLTFTTTTLDVGIYGVYWHSVVWSVGRKGDTMNLMVYNSSDSDALFKAAVYKKNEEELRCFGGWSRIILLSGASKTFCIYWRVHSSSSGNLTAYIKEARLALFRLKESYP